jgi:mono/diheme cytochrome c family protein
MMPSGRKQLLLWIAAALGATAALTIILVREHQPTARHVLYVVGDSKRGRELFFGDKQCSICHSIEGQGGRIAPDLSETHPGSPAMGWLATVLWNHAPGMYRRIRTGVSYPHLDTGEMADILAFLYESASAEHPGNPTAGRDVFEQKGCVRCHSVRSWGGKSAPDLSEVAAGSASEWTRAMWNHAGSMIAPISAALGEWPQFMGNDMDNLIAYVNEGKTNPTQATRGDPQQGWHVFQARCIQCHSVGGQGGKLGPELGPDRELPVTTAQFASVLWNHAPTMLRLSQEKGITPPILNGSEMADLAAFLGSLRFFEPVGSPFIGERVFSERGCARCHGPSAGGTKLAPPIVARSDAFTTVSLTSALWKHGPKMVDRTEQLNIPWPVLEPTDIGNLVSFLNAPHHQSRSPER